VIVRIARLTPEMGGVYTMGDEAKLARALNDLCVMSPTAVTTIGDLHSSGSTSLISFNLVHFVGVE
jgi:hypothetical protein